MKLRGDTLGASRFLGLRVQGTLKISRDVQGDHGVMWALRCGN